MSPGSPAGLLLLCTYVWLAAAVSVSKPGPVQVVSRSGEDCVLQCTAEHTPGIPYMTVRWYKDGEDPLPRLSGLLSKNLPNGTIRRYANARPDVELLEETHDMLMSNLTCADSGVYTCYLAAPVGEQNREGQVLLILTDCPSILKENLAMDGGMVILATAVLILAFITSIISYVIVKNIFRDRNKTTKKQTFLESAFKPVEEKDLMLIYTLGPKVSKTATTKQISV